MTIKYSQKTDRKARGMELLVSYQQTHSIQVRNQLVELNTGLVQKIAHQVSHQCAENYEDLEQIGYLGLIRAIERFDPTKGTAFSSFAVPYVRGEMLHFLRDKSSLIKIPRRLLAIHKQGEKVEAILANQLGRSPREDRIAEALHISIQDWRQSQFAGQNRTPLSLDMTVYFHGETTLTLAETLIDRHAQEITDDQEDRQELKLALSQLEVPTQMAIELVFIKNISRQETARTMGISPMTVTRKIKKGLDRLINLLNPCLLQPEAEITRPIFSRLVI